ncbi:hypothetical protein Bbelb_054980 [Branchiostoma belcheri]|nr:hypothetical protein Bbelb_054980 [Branchiostoma belcheri]
MSEEEQQSQACNASATPMRQPEPYWRSRAETAAKIPNPMYASNAGTTPQPQSLRSRADDAAKTPNPMYASNAGATRMRQPLSYWRSLANAAAKMFNPMYAFSSADLPMHQPQTDYKARENDDENTPDATYAYIPDDPPMDQPQARANDDKNTSDATHTTISDDAPINQPQTDHQARANDDGNTPDTTHPSKPDGAHPGGASGRRGVCSFLRAHRSCLAAGIAVLLSLIAVGLAPLTFSNKQEISQLSTTVKRDQDDIRHLSATVDALKRGQDALKGYQDDMRQLSAAVNALKREQDGIPTAVDDLKRDLDNERSRTATLDQRLHVIEKTLPSCPEGYTIWRGICYKAFDARKSFSEAAATCRADGGTLAMPRDADTNAFLFSLYMSVNVRFAYWIGLHDQTKEGRFEWVDGSALGPYNSWAKGEPEKYGADEDCVAYSRKITGETSGSTHPATISITSYARLFQAVHKRLSEVSPLLYNCSPTIRSQPK